MATLELKKEAQTPPRIQNTLDTKDFAFNRARRTALAQLFPSVYLLATVKTELNQCVIELLYSDNNGVPESSFSSSKRLSTGEPLDSNDSVFGGQKRPPLVPESLLNQFRTPLVIQVVHQDEGLITCVEFAVDSSSVKATSPSSTTPGGKALPDIAKSGRKRSPSLIALEGSLSSLYVHLFIGTSHGTVICCNALRGTILVMAQFQYRPPFLQNKSGGCTTNTDGDGFVEEDVPDNDTPNKTKKITQIFSRVKKENEPVVKFVLHRRPTALQYNPSVNMSTSKLAPLVGVYVIHAGGRVVVFNRSVLDVFVQAAADKLDGRRPNFAVDWSPEEISYPVAGAAAPFASQIQSVYVLRKLSKFSTNECVTYKKEKAAAARIHEMRSGASGSDDDTVIRDASYFLFLDDTDVTNVLSQTAPTVDALILCGRKPAVSIYPLEPQHEEYSATRSVKAIVSKAKNLWYTAWGKQRAEPPKKLEEIPQLASTGMLEGDSTFSTVVVDPSQQCAALFCEEGSGRLYLVDIPTGTIWRVLKGCREAQFQFWMVNVRGKRVLCIVVHLPLRQVVEVHAVRIVQRLAACSVPEGALLLPPTSETSSPVLIDAMGGVHTLVLDTEKIQKDTEAYETATATTAPMGVEGRRAPRLSQTANGEFVNAATLRACRTPDVYLNLALCLPLPFTEPLTAGAMMDKKKFDEESKALGLFVAQTQALCEHLKLRFAPSSTDIRTLPYDATMQDRLQCGAPPADSLTASQCLHYVQLRVTAVESYTLLSRCVSPTPAEIGALFATEKSTALWNALLVNVRDNKEAAAAWASAVQTTLLLLQAKPASGSAASPLITADTFNAFWQPQDESARKPADLLGRSSALAMELKAFLGCFFFGESRIRFLSDTIKWQEELLDDNSDDLSSSAATPPGSRHDHNVFLSLALLIFEKGALPAFLSQMEVVAQLGMSTEDLCLLVLSYVAYRATTSMAAFLQETNVGMLSFVLGTFSDATFLGTLAYFALPLLSREKAKGSSTAAPVWRVDARARPSLTCLLLCCTLRFKEREALLTDMAIEERHQWRLTLGKLFSLWRLSGYSGAEAAFQDITTTSTPSSPTSKVATFPQAANVTLRLKNLHMGDASASTAVSAGDTLESVLQRKGLPPGVVLQLQQHLRADATQVEKAQSYVRLMAIYQPTEGTAAASWNTSEFPWLRQGNWYSAHFESLVVQPLEDAWQKQYDDALFFQSCVVVLSWNVCHNLVCRNFENAFLFFPTHTVPSTNFLSRVQSGCSPLEQTERKEVWLAEGRSTRNYLQSMIKLVKFVRRATREMLLGQRDDKVRSPTMSKGDISDKSQAQRVRIVQTIISAMSDDDDLVFPCVPQPLRGCLENMKHVVGNAPLLLLSRLDGLYSFLQLVLLFVDGAIFQVNGKSLSTEVAAVPIHWGALFQSPPSYFDFLDLFCDRTGTAPHHQRDTSSSSVLMDQDDREIRLIRQRLRASSVLVRDLLDIAIMQDDHVPSKNYLSDASVARLFSKDTAAILDKVCQITDVSTYVPDVTPLFLFDYQIKHLCPNKEITKTFANLANKKHGAVIAVANLRLLIAAVMAYCEAIRKPNTRTTVLREGTTYEADDFIGRIYRLLTETKCLQWVKRLETDIKRTAEDLTGTAMDGRVGQVVGKKKSEGPFSSEVIGGYSWVTPREQVDVVKRVQLRLTSSTFSSQRTDFAELLFALAQIGNENPAGMSEEIAVFVHELPRVANGLRSVI